MHCHFRWSHPPWWLYLPFTVENSKISSSSLVFLITSRLSIQLPIRIHTDIPTEFFSSLLLPSPSYSPSSQATVSASSSLVLPVSDAFSASNTSLTPAPSCHLAWLTYLSFFSQCRFETHSLLASPLLFSNLFSNSEDCMSFMTFST